MEHYRLFIDGQFVDSSSQRCAESIDPGTGKPFATFPVADKNDANKAVDAARKAFDSGVWSDLSPEARANILFEYADLLQAQAARLSKLESIDSGGLLKRTRGDVSAGARMIKTFARYAVDSFPWVEPIKNTGNPFIPSRNYVRREPIGVCVGIVPWNFPFSMAMWKLTMAVVTGNTIVLKPASDTPLSTLLMCEAVAKSRIPKGVINVIAGPGAEVGETLCTNPSVDKIAFTGSTEVGRRIMTLGAETIKKVSLELGGKSANIVLKDADMELSVDGALLATFFHSGQVCESGTRLLLLDSLYDEFVERLVARAKTIRIGYQLDNKSRMGPVVSARQRATIESYIAIGKEEGATLAYGGGRAEVQGYEEGYYLQPTIFTEVKNSMRIAREEIFGPVLSVIRYKDEDEAVEIANDSIYGLAGGIWSRDIARAEQVAKRIRTGTMWINDFHVFSDLCPFGGYKQSGVGRELGHHGLEEYTEVKHVHVGSTGKPAAHPVTRILLDHPGATGSFEYMGSTRLRSGAGEVSILGSELSELGLKRVFMVTDKGIIKANLLEPVRLSLGDFIVGTFDDVPQDSSMETIDQAAKLARECRADVVISVGGGSVIDTAKGVSLLLTNPGNAVDYVGISLANSAPAPHIAIPTTAGTGSEVTAGAVVHHKAIGRKIMFVDKRIAPILAILDPLMTTSLPPALTASTGMDTLTHGIEAAVSRRSNPVTEGMALQAVRIAAGALPKVMADGSDLTARLKMQISASMAGWAFNTAQLGLAHAIAHSLGAHCGVPHGTANGIVLPHVMRYVVESCIPQMALVGTALGVKGSSEEEIAKGAAGAVDQILSAIGHPLKLRNVGIEQKDLAPCAALSLIDPASFTSPRMIRTVEEFIALYEKAW